MRRDALLPAESYKPPLSPAQLQLAAIWAEALNFDRVGIEDDFFELGGDSMSATVICSEVERLTGRKAVPSLLLKASTVASFAAAVDSDFFKYVGEIVVPSRTVGSHPPLVLIHGLDGNIFFVRRLSWLMPPEQPVYGVQAQGLDGSKPPQGTVEQMVDTYSTEIFRVVGTRPFVLGGFCMGGIIAIEVLRRLQALGARVLRLVMIDPPPKPLRGRGQVTRQGREVMRVVRSQKIAKRMEQLAIGRPDIASYYQPGGDGFDGALRVSESLATAYANFLPRPTDHPATILWSVDRAQQLGGRPSLYPLTKGRTTAFIVRNKKFDVTHQVLMHDGIEAVAKLLQEVMRRVMEEQAAPAVAAEARPAAE